MLTPLQNTIPVFVGGVIAAVSGWLTSLSSNRRQERLQKSILQAQQEFQRGEAERQRSTQLFDKRIEALKAYHVASREGSRKVGFLLDALSARLEFPETLSAETLSTAFADYAAAIEALAKWHGEIGSEAIVVDSLFDQKAPEVKLTSKTFHTTTVPITSSKRKLQDPTDRAATARELSEEIAKMKEDMTALGRKQVAYLGEVGKSLRSA